MQLTTSTPRKSLNKAYLKVKPTREEIELFKTEILSMLDHADDEESEEFHKNLISEFLKKTYYQPQHYINTHGRNDLVIHNGSTAKTSVGVIMETKSTTNTSEMVSEKNTNTKSLQELVLYYLRERITQKNLEIRHLVITNLYEWYIFDVQDFDRLFAQNKKLVQQFEDFEAGRLADTTTTFFYTQIIKPYIGQSDAELSATYLDLRKYDKIIRNSDLADDKKLIPLYKIFSPEHLLKLPFANDSNSLDKKFYTELLHIIGLEEVKEGNKKIIQRTHVDERNSGSLLENTITQLDTLDKLSRLAQPSQYGSNREERLYTVALELVLTWVNRILFLKLLEAQLLSYHQGDNAYVFLDFERIRNYDDLNSLFFEVLAVRQSDRPEEVREAFAKIPYLNSSLFEPTALEQDMIMVSNLRDERTMPILSNTVLKDTSGKRISGELSTLQYLFDFLDAYDFSSEGGEEIQEENKNLINASVLGLIFEKINGYKDGAFFTPGYITMYMCRETLRRAVVQKFNQAHCWDCETLTEVYNRIPADKKREANEVINSLKICDPAVGSGHFLVSALNELMAIKSELGILIDSEGKWLKEYRLEVVSDELIITHSDGDLYEYQPKSKESLRVQRTLFHEKQTLIENCLYGVDINPNSVKICRLRLWIELLKNAYYKNDTELETLPNIDINIKCGNSLVSRFGLDSDLSQALKKSKWTIDSYRLAVKGYQNAQTKEEKREMERIIADVKSDFETNIDDPFKAKLQKARGKVFNLTAEISNYSRFGEKVPKALETKLEKAKVAEAKVEVELEERQNNAIYQNAFEWRFEFPEVLDDEGAYVGFDVVIGNPPYISMTKIKEGEEYYSANYETYVKGTDMYCLFIERGVSVLRREGVMTYITSNSWIRAKYGDQLKAYISKNLQPQLVINIEDVQLFDEATVETNIIIGIKETANKPFYVVNMQDDFDVSDSLAEYINENKFLFEIPEHNDWFLGPPRIKMLKEKIESKGKVLGDYSCKINRGILTGYNNAFIIAKDKRDELIASDPKNSDIIKPILRGRDVHKYNYEFDNTYLINSHNGLKNEGIAPIDIVHDYPTVYEYLEEFLPKVKNRYDKGTHWTNLRNCAYLHEFDKPKIIWGEISDKPKFAYDDSDYYVEATCFLMTGEMLQYILAILNSKVSEWYFHLIGTTTGMGTNRWKKYKIEQLPIVEPTKTQESAITTLVTQILELKKDDPTADTSALESEIDQLVYQLYDLTEEEVAIVEGEG